MDDDLKCPTSSGGSQVSHSCTPRCATHTCTPRRLRLGGISWQKRMIGGSLSSNGFVYFFFHLQVVSWVLTSPLAQAPVLVRKPSSHAHSSANTQPCARSHPLRAIKYVTNGKPEPPSADFARSPPMSVHPRMFALRRGRDTKAERKEK